MVNPFALWSISFELAEKLFRTLLKIAAAIIKILGETYLKTLNTNDEWVKILRKFKERWNFPKGLGGTDDKQIVLQEPKSSGSHYRNYKETDSII